MLTMFKLRIRSLTLLFFTFYLKVLFEIMTKRVESTNKRHIFLRKSIVLFQDL